MTQETSHKFETPDDQGIKFDRTINLGHVLTFVGFLLTCAMVYGTLDKRVTLLEDNRIAQVVIDRRQDDAINDDRKTMREDLKDIVQKLDHLIEKVELRK